MAARSALAITVHAVTVGLHAGVNTVAALRPQAGLLWDVPRWSLQG